MSNEQSPSPTDPIKEKGNHEQLILAELFEEYGVSQHYKKNEIIFREDEESQYIYFVRSGLVKISQSAQEGHGITLFLRSTGEVFGAAEVLTGQHRQRFARCILNSEVLLLPADHFRSLLQSRPDVLYALTVSNARRLLSTQRYVETLVSRPVAWRLAYFLNQIGEWKHNEIHVRLPLSHEEMSYIIGCSRQTITETLNKWKEQNLIQYEKKRVIIYDCENFMSKH
ncbi:Crp/Fnr family transcriptional regulator [Paenibacillus allorhizosphaerae]|uniref:Global nitrogen regulator n=1 Tax=Paenibacillus allorhizosphaerae TaxID=2849866 RepID=A0ABM8VPA6_9BACL|nr:Crp/Fnr family transcriptional regulator [Paenibacillus allorhizosphaerae]CAG7652640.1 Global nitrogen regulator [Paenibacillus allorhizosphaerae]